MADTPDPITRLYRKCNPRESLQPDDPRYVNFDEVRGENLAKLFERSLRRADPLEPDVKLLAGHRGCGKTSELLRLKRMLEKPQRESDKPFLVIFFDAADSLDPNDLDFPDLLVFTAGEVQRQLRKADIPGFDAVTTGLQSLWDSLKSLLPKSVKLKLKDVDVQFLPLALELKNRPTARQELREAIEKQSTSLLAAVNDLLTMATTKLRESGREGLVLLIDGLDKLVLRKLPGGTNTHDRLFLDRSDQMASLKAHTVYTVPISLIYSPRCAQLEQSFGEPTVPIPMINLRGENHADVTPETPGMKKLWEMLEKRCAAADLKIADVFDTPQTGHYLCEMTGGHPRHLTMFIQAACNKVDALPITHAAAEAAVQHYANSLQREITDDAWLLLPKFTSPQADIPKDEQHQQMLFMLHVFEYMNDRPWYEVNPVIRTLPKSTVPQ